MHASHATHDVKTDLLRSGEARKIKGTGRSGYLGVKGSQVQILSARLVFSLVRGMFGVGIRPAWNIRGTGSRAV